MAARKKSVTKATSGKMKMNSMMMLSWILVTVGALNWGLVGLVRVDLVESLLGSWPALVQIVYILIGLSGIYSLWGMFMM